MSKNWVKGVLLFFLIVSAVGCASPQFYSHVVYENPTSFVRLEFSPWAESASPETWNAHPVTLSQSQIDNALKGLRVREHRAAPIRWVRGEAELEPAFHEAEIELLGPRLLEGLELAVSQELVTFYVSHPVNATTREVTSGGLYVTDGRLHIILSNYRSVYGIPPAGLIYDRRFPLFSLGPLGVDIFYQTGNDALVQAEQEDLYDAIFGDERSGEIVLELSQLSMMDM